MLPSRMPDLDALDRADPLRGFRDRFVLPDGVIYLDGNSLGGLPSVTSTRVTEVIEREWGDGLIRSWNQAGWIDLPRRVGAKIARLVGARDDEVIVADSTSINLFKLLAGALDLNPQRRVPAEAVMKAIDESVAVVSLTHVDYRSGRMHDLAEVTTRAHQVGALMLW